MVKNARPRPPSPRHQPTPSDASAFIRKVKQKLWSSEYAAFLAALKEVKAPGGDAFDVLPQLTELLGGNDELVSGLNQFLPEDYRISVSGSNSRHNWLSAKSAAVDFLNKISAAFEDDDDGTYRAFIDIMERIGGDADQVYPAVANLFRRHPVLLAEFSKFTTECHKRVVKLSPRQTRIPCSTNNGLEPTRTDPRVRPRKSAVKRQATCRHNLNRERCQEVMQRVEDDRFEMDMVVKYFDSVFEHAEKFLQDYDKDRTVIAKKYFTIHDERCIERLYGNYGEDIIDLLWGNPAQIVKDVLPRLKQKLKHFGELRSEMNSVWSQACKKYHAKALDYFCNCGTNQVPKERKRQPQQKKKHMELRLVDGNWCIT